MKRGKEIEIDIDRANERGGRETTVKSAWGNDGEARYFAAGRKLEKIVPCPNE